MQTLRRFVAELMAVLAIQVRPCNSTMAQSYGRRRGAPRGAELVHSTLSHTVLASRDCRDRMERRRGAQAKCMCSSEARKPAYRLATAASRILRCALCTHRRIHLQGVRAWVRSAASVAVLSASLGPGVWRRAARVFVAIHEAHLTGTAIISFRWTCSYSCSSRLLPAMALGSTLAR
jgi:hypothetical protein